MTNTASTDRAAALIGFLDQSPFVQTMGITCDVRGDEMTASLPYKPELIGNTFLPALHGGGIGAFLEITAMAQVFLSSQTPKPPRPIDLTVDYLRSAGPKTLYGRAHIQRMGRRMINVRAEAWQDERSKAVAALHAHFLVES